MTDVSMLKNVHNLDLRYCENMTNENIEKLKGINPNINIAL